MAQSVRCLTAIPATFTACKVLEGGGEDSKEEASPGKCCVQAGTASNRTLPSAPSLTQGRKTSDIREQKPVKGVKSFLEERALFPKTINRSQRRLCLTDLVNSFKQGNPTTR